MQVGSNTKTTRVTPAILLTIINFVNKRNSLSQTVSVSMIIGKVKDSHGITLSRRTIRRKIQQMGKTWVHIKQRREPLLPNIIRL